MKDGFTCLYLRFGYPYLDINFRPVAGTLNLTGIDDDRYDSPWIYTTTKPLNSSCHIRLRAPQLVGYLIFQQQIQFSMPAK